MPKPKPKVLNEVVDKKFNTTQVYKVEDTFVLGYKGEPVNIKTFYSLANNPYSKYKKLSSNTFGTIERMVRDMNKLFHTTDFRVMRATGYEVVEREVQPKGGKTKIKPVDTSAKPD